MPEWKYVGLIGSSGGGRATLGHTNVPTATIDAQLKVCHAKISAFSFVICEEGMDGVHKDSSVIYYRNDGTMSGSLAEINHFIRETEDERLAALIQKGSIDGLICISCHASLYPKTFQAAAMSRIPVTGSGGTSLSLIVSLYRIHLTGNAGGSVATTAYTRAVSYTYALASAWKRDYRQPHNNSSESLTSVLNACLPVFWTVCLIRTIISWTIQLLKNDHGDHVSVFERLHKIDHSLAHYALPSTCAIIMTSRDDDLPTSLLLMASLISVSSFEDSSILAGLLAGWLVRFFTQRILFRCIVHNVPATMATLVTTGGTALLTSCLVVPLAPLLFRITSWVRFLIQWSVLGLSSRTWSTAPMGFIWGCLFCYGSKVGWYHSYFLPLILIEMETGEASFLGAVDELTLVLVCAGICAGKMTMCHGSSESYVSSTDVALCQRGFRTNILFGDFVEACYPFMDESMIINMGSYLASGMSVAWLVREDSLPKSFAYLFWPVSVGLAQEHWPNMLTASLMAFFIPYFCTIVAAFVDHKKKTE